MCIRDSIYNYRNVFDPADGFFKGRDREGRFDEGFNPYEWGGPFVEGNGWQWRFSVPVYYTHLHHGRTSADRCGSCPQMAQDELLHIDGTDRRIDHRSPRAGLCERHGRKRHARRGILDRLSRRDVSPRADGADIHSLRSVTNLIRIRP